MAMVMTGAATTKTVTVVATATTMAMTTTTMAILRILQRRNYSATIIVAATLSRRAWNILLDIIGVGLVGNENSLYNDGSTPCSILCGISACGGCITLDLRRLPSWYRCHCHLLSNSTAGRI
jgi:hypothetical protein